MSLIRLAATFCCGLVVLALAILLRQAFYQKAMLRHLQQCLAWKDQAHLKFPTQQAYFRHCERQSQKGIAQEGTA